MRRQVGMAMVIVLWVLSLLTIMAGSFALTMRRETTIISAARDNAVALATAEIGVTVAKQMMLLTDGERRWLTDGQTYHLKYQDAEIRVKILSEHGKVDINKAGEALLTQIISVTTLDMTQQQALVSAILDWRDADDLVHINGAEKLQYEEADLSYQPANKDFQRIEEIQMVLGMNNKVFKQLQPFITVYSGNANVNLKVAAIEVIKAVKGIEFEDESERLEQDERSGNSNTQKGQSIQNNNVYTVISEAQHLGGFTAGVKVILKRMGSNRSNPFQVLNWQPIYQELSLFKDESNHELKTE